jgi:hypothetical protein
VRKYGYLVQQIEKALSDLGAMTGAELCQELGVEKAELSAVVSRMAKPSKTMPKRIYVQRYIYEHETHDRRYPRAVYALGDIEDKPKPKPNRKETVRRYNDNKRKRLTGNSVFNLGLPRRIYEQRTSSAVTQ